MGERERDDDEGLGNFYVCCPRWRRFRQDGWLHVPKSSFGGGVG